MSNENGHWASPVVWDPAGFIDAFDLARKISPAAVFGKVAGDSGVGGRDGPAPRCALFVDQIWICIVILATPFPSALGFSAAPPDLQRTAIISKTARCDVLSVAARRTRSA